MAYCRKCGAKTDAEDKFCPDCGAKMGAKAQPAKAPEGKKPASPEPQKQTQTSQVQTAAGILLGIIVLVAILYFTGLLDINTWTQSPVTSYCPQKAGYTLCGYCNSTDTTNPHAGKCRYCLFGSSCSGDICGDLKCSGGNTNTIAQTYCSSGNCLSNGHCCPSSSRYYCGGYCYGTSSDANSHGCYSFNIYC